MDGLELYTIYERPLDYPYGYVVRRFEIRGGVEPVACEGWYVPTLAAARNCVPPNLHCLGRAPGDESQIVETWI
jgi:hypothetical protein